jgi:hypothetical protein
MIVEKVFFQKPEGDGYKAIDLRKGNPYTFFMVGFCVTYQTTNYKRKNIFLFLFNKGIYFFIIYWNSVLSESLKKFL